MEAALKRDFLTVEEYLEGEEQSDIKHEYIGGIVFAMAGGTVRHVLLSSNFLGPLHAHLRGGPCRVFGSDLRVRLFLSERDLFYYPDVTVACDPRDDQNEFKRYPKVVVEVLSETTEKTDRREKFWNYTQIETLEEYVLIEQDKMEVTVFRRANRWAPDVVNSPEAMIRLASINFKLRLSELYEGVTFPA